MTAAEQKLLDDAVAVCRMVLSASMSSGGGLSGESSIGWQRSDGATADTIKSAARDVIARVPQKADDPSPKINNQLRASQLLAEIREHEK